LYWASKARELSSLIKQSMAKTGIVKDIRYLDHIAHYPHVESPKRLRGIYAVLEEGDLAGKFMEITPRMANHWELEWIHTPAYINHITSTKGKPLTILDPDTYASPLSYDTAKLAVGGVFSILDYLFRRDISNGFALVRPPGHHAEANRAMGFCIFNNIALGAKYAMQVHGAKKALIVDWDLHHGNGTQNAFYKDPHVLYFSTHQFPYYPGSGNYDEVGEGEGKGYTVNVPLRAGQDDKVYIQIFRRILSPIALSFKPDIILVSAGFDVYFDDPLGGMRVTPKGLAAITRILLGLAGDLCDGKILFVLEGGYNIKGLRECMMAVLKEMFSESILKEDDLSQGEEESINPHIEKVIKFQKQFWPL